MKSGRIYVNFYAPPELVKDFDKSIEGKYNSRTDALMDLMRKFVQKEQKQ